VKAWLAAHPTLGMPLLQAMGQGMAVLSHASLEHGKRCRNGETYERVVRGVHLTINGIAAGLMNSG
jgi:phosphoenolpyruvate carboxylase